MDFEHKSTDESGNRGVLDDGDLRIREVLKAGSEERELAKLPVGSASRECLVQKQPTAIEKSARIAIKTKRRILFINAADFIAVVANGNYVMLFHSSGSHRLRESISTIEEKLSLHGFVRIHRSVLVNAAMVEEIHPSSTGDYVLRVRGGREFTVARTYKKNLQLLAQSWIGMEGFVAD